MGRQSSRNSRREQSRDPEIIESNNVNDAKFKTLVVKMLSELMGSVDEFSENVNKKIKSKKGNGNYKREPVRNEEHIICHEKYINWYKQTE